MATLGRVQGEGVPERSFEVSAGVFGISMSQRDNQLKIMKSQKGTQRYIKINEPNSSPRKTIVASAG